MTFSSDGKAAIGFGSDLSARCYTETCQILLAEPGFVECMCQCKQGSVMMYKDA